ncbi:MAG: hypothetical protein AAGC63_00270 [Propionicimonas sp.]|nr:hypothetical protein [Propionicimonas sp.]
MVEHPLEFLPGSGEYVTWPVTGLPAEAHPAVSIDGGQTWTDAEVVSGSIRVFVAHHTMESPPVGALILPSGSHKATIRVVDTPEEPHRRAGILVGVRPPT